MILTMAVVATPTMDGLGTCLMVHGVPKGTINVEPFHIEFPDDDPELFRKYWSAYGDQIWQEYQAVRSAT